MSWSGARSSENDKSNVTLPSATLHSSSTHEGSVFFGRLVVALVIGSVIIVGTLSAAVGIRFEESNADRGARKISFLGYQLLVSRQRPPFELVLLALAAILIIAICAVSFEVIAARMSISPRRRTLTSLRSDVDLFSHKAGKVKITILIPAHNEEYSLPRTLQALSEQSRKPNRVIVVADNCTDRTVEIAHEMGYETFETVGNTHKKGGALNQVLSHLLPVAGPQDVILVMDADTSLGPKFLEVAGGHLEKDPELSAVGGVFFGEEGHGFIGQLQRNEYSRYSKQIKARRGRVFVLTGTATMFRSTALLDVAAARGIYIPGTPGKVYDTTALTEDNELTLALKSLGATMVSPAECTVVTELMPNWKSLWIQRQRWQRGALENLGAYGMTKATIRYWGQQLGIGYGTVALNLAVLLALITYLSIDQVIWFPFWMGVGLVFLVERVATAWDTGWRGRALAMLLIPELMYDIFQQAVFVNSLYNISTAKEATWGHVQHPAASS